IFLYSLTSQPWALVALQSLDGIGAGIYGVVIVAICADLTRGRGGFYLLPGVVATAVGAGGGLWPLGCGLFGPKPRFSGGFPRFGSDRRMCRGAFHLPHARTRAGRRDSPPSSSFVWDGSNCYDRRFEPVPSRSRIMPVIRALTTVGLLIASNVFMTTAWYGH